MIDTSQLVGRIWTVSKAIKLARILQTDPLDDWNYVVEIGGDYFTEDFARIAVSDETGKFVGYL